MRSIILLGKSFPYGNCSVNDLRQTAIGIRDTYSTFCQIQMATFNIKRLETENLYD